MHSISILILLPIKYYSINIITGSLNYFKEPITYLTKKKNTLHLKENIEVWHPPVRGRLMKTCIRFIFPNRAAPHWGKRRHWAAPFIINQLIKRGSLPLSHSRWWMEREGLESRTSPLGKREESERDQMGEVSVRCI